MLLNQLQLAPFKPLTDCATGFTQARRAARTNAAAHGVAIDSVAMDILATDSVAMAATARNAALIGCVGSCSVFNCLVIN